MELVANNNIQSMIQDQNEIMETSSSGFIEANTTKVTLEHLRDDCIIPVFSKDNETTISHYQFIKEAQNVVENLFGEYKINEPDIRVSHVIKGRIPTAIGKPAKELLEHEKTIYYERCAFLIEIPEITETVNGNKLTLSIGGVRSLSQENLYSRKSLEKFKIFIGFKNRVCTNLCVSTDGFTNEVRISSALDLEDYMQKLFSGYNRLGHLEHLKALSNYHLNQNQFAHMIGKTRMYNHLSKEDQKQIIPIGLNDGQINNVVKDYYNCPNFGSDKNGNIDLWRLYNLFTEANKSSYIDSNFERNLLTYEYVNHLANCIKNGSNSWYYD